MTHFPVTNSNLSAPHLALFLQEKYALSTDTKCQLIRAGINDTYLVTSGNVRFVFRIYSLNWRTQTEITEEIKLLNVLKENHIPISYPLCDIENHYIQTLNAPEGDRFAVLFTYANGQKIDKVSTDVHFQIGAFMAQLHKVTVNQTLKRVSYTPEVILMDSLKQVAPFLSADSEEMIFMQTTQKYLLRQFLDADTEAIRNGIIHLDIWFDNLNITHNNNVTIFDFDFCGNGWLILDIAYYILQLHNVEKYEESNYQPKIDRFLAGYESITKISDEEKRLIPMLGVSLYFFYLGIQCQRFENWSNSFLNENYVKRYIQSLIKKYFYIYNYSEERTDV